MEAISKYTVSFGASLAITSILSASSGAEGIK